MPWDADLLHGLLRGGGRLRGSGAWQRDLAGELAFPCGRGGQRRLGRRVGVQSGWFCKVYSWWGLWKSNQVEVNTNDFHRSFIDVRRATVLRLQVYSDCLILFCSGDWF